eukprot:COSAG02_NODE_55891_length_288_cov_0.804233_1_plen_22_part_10
MIPGLWNEIIGACLGFVAGGRG